MIHRRTLSPTEPRYPVYSLGNDDLRIVYGIWIGCLIGGGVWTALWVFVTCLSWLRGWS